MARLRSLFARIAAMFLRRELDERIDGELQFHIGMQTEENLRRGMTPREARRQARIECGGVEQVKELHRDTRGLPSLESLLQDVRYGFRQLSNHRGFAAVVILTLALGIGANTAVFSGVHFALLETIAAASPGELVWIGLIQDGRDDAPFTSIGFYEELRSVASPFQGFGAVATPAVAVRAGATTELLPVELATSTYFPLLGVSAELGRVFGEGDRDSAVAVLEYSFWRARFGRDPDVIGRTVQLTGQPYTIIGVAPEGFRGLSKDSKPALWIPIENTPHALPDFQRWRDPYPGLTFLRIFARLPRGADPAAAQAAADLALSRLRHRAPNAVPTRMTGVRLRPAVYGDPSRREGAAETLKLLGAVVGLILLLSCANVASLTLGRGLMRRPEISIRLALGAGKFRVMRQLLVESLILASLGGAAGTLLAWIVAPWIGAQLDLNEDLPLNLPVLGFAIALSLVSGILFGVAPAWASSDVPLAGCLKGGGLGTAKRRWGATLVALQAALCIPVLVAAGLLNQTLYNLYAVPTGLTAEQVVQGKLNPRANGYDLERSMRVFEELQRRLAARPEVRSVAFGRATTFSDRTSGRNLIRDSDEPFSRNPGVKYSWVSNDYFATLGIPVLYGRTFTASDTNGAPKVVVVNRTLARLISGDESAVGRRVRSSVNRPDLLTVVGVVGDNVQNDLRSEVAPLLYLPVAQRPIGDASVYVRAIGSPEAVAKLLPAELAAVDPNIPITEIRTMAESVDRSLRVERRLAGTLNVFGAIGLAIAAVGLYGVLSFALARKTREMGLRKALGAQSADITRMIVGRGLAWVGSGALVGVAAAGIARSLLEATLFGVKPTDPATYAGAGALLLAVAGLAAFLPARRAARIEPMEALRHE